MPLRKKIVEIAIKEFAENGYKSADLKRIRENAQVDSETFNSYFTKKDDLYRACFEFFQNEKMEIIERTLRTPQSYDDYKTRVHLFVDEMIYCLFENPYTYEIVYRESKETNEIMHQIFSDTLRPMVFEVVSFFETSKNLGFVRESCDPKLLARFIFTLIEDVKRNEELGRVHFGHTAENKDFKEVIAEQITSMFLDGTAKTSK